jgi:hypothetical protein
VKQQGAFEGIKQLVQMYGADNIVIVSKCGPKVQRQSLEWLSANAFWDTTGMLPNNAHFCLEVCIDRE